MFRWEQRLPHALSAFFYPNTGRAPLIDDGCERRTREAHSPSIPRAERHCSPLTRQTGMRRLGLLGPRARRRDVRRQARSSCMCSRGQGVGSAQSELLLTEAALGCGDVGSSVGIGLSAIPLTPRRVRMCVVRPRHLRFHPWSLQKRSSSMHVFIIRASKE